MSGGALVDFEKTEAGKSAKKLKKKWPVHAMLFDFDDFACQMESMIVSLFVEGP